MEIINAEKSAFARTRTVTAERIIRSTFLGIKLSKGGGNRPKYVQYEVTEMIMKGER